MLRFVAPAAIGATLVAAPAFEGAENVQPQRQALAQETAGPLGRAVAVQLDEKVAIIARDECVARSATCRQRMLSSRASVVTFARVSHSSENTSRSRSQGSFDALGPMLPGKGRHVQLDDCLREGPRRCPPRAKQ